MPKKTHIPHGSPKTPPSRPYLTVVISYRQIFDKILRNNKNVVYPKKQMHITISKNKANNLRKNVGS